eukprot:gene14243-16847_t
MSGDYQPSPHQTAQQTATNVTSPASAPGPALPLDSTGTDDGAMPASPAYTEPEPKVEDPQRVTQRSPDTRSKRMSIMRIGNRPGPGDVEAMEEQERRESAQKPVRAAAAGEEVSTSQSSALPRMTAAYMSRAGKEPGYGKTNQDTCFAHVTYGPADAQSVFGVFDGHGPQGHESSGEAKEALPRILLEELASQGTAEKALKATFPRVHTLTSDKVNCEFSGTTAVVVHVKGSALTCGWVGDSRAVVGREGPDGNTQCIALSADHKPDQSQELHRIQSNNGRVDRLVDQEGRQVGPYRVWLRYAWIPGLAMSRSLGDTLAHRVGVSCDPDISKHELTEKDRFLILASDGVWEFISNEEAVGMVSKASSPEEAAEQLVTAAHERWAAEEDGVVDDITVVVVNFNRSSSSVEAVAAVDAA